MNCRPGDLARVVSLDPRLGLNDRIVQLTNEPAFMLEGAPHWHLVQPLQTVLKQTGVNMVTGALYPAGRSLIAWSMADHYLRPIRDPGDDAVDEMVQRVGPAPMTLTEILQGEVTS